MTLRFLLDAIRKQKRSLTVVFVDYSMPSIQWTDELSRSLSGSTVFLTRLSRMWRSCIMVPPQQSKTRFWHTEPFDTTSGVPQGDTLSPHLFIPLVDCILRQSLVDEDRFTLKPANGRRHPSVILNALPYADYVAITSYCASGAERTLRWLKFHSEAIGLKLNAAKPKVFHVGYGSDPEQILTLEGTMIDVCDTHNYLGLTTLSSKIVILQIFAAEWSAIGKLRPMFHSTAPDAMKI